MGVQGLTVGKAGVSSWSRPKAACTGAPSDAASGVAISEFQNATGVTSCAVGAPHQCTKYWYSRGNRDCMRATSIRHTQTAGALVTGGCLPTWLRGAEWGLPPFSCSGDSGMDSFGAPT